MIRLKRTLSPLHGLVLAAFLVVTPVILAGEIHEAVEAGNADEVLRLLRENPELITSKDQDGRSPLRLAIADHSYEMTGIIILNTRAAYVEPMFEPENSTATPDEIKNAYSLLTQLLRERPGDAAVNFAYGMTCLLKRDYPRARLAFVRVLALNRSNLRARYELGRVYIHMNQPDMARKEFKTVLNQNPRDDVKRAIEQWMRTAGKPEKKSRTMFRLEGGGFLDSNVNVGPKFQTISIAPLIFGSTVLTELAVDETSQPLESYGYYAAATLQGLVDSGEQGSWQMVWSATSYENFLESDAEDYENIYAQAVWGYRKIMGASILMLPVRASYIGTGGDPLVSIYGIVPGFITWGGADHGWQWMLSGTCEARDYDSLDNRDGYYSEIGGTLKRTFGDKGDNISMGVALFSDVTDAEEYENTGSKWFVAGEYRLPARSAVFAKVSRQRSEYKKPELLSPLDREDNQSQYAVGLRCDVTPFLGLGVSCQVTENNSTFALYEYDRQVTMVNMSVTF